MLICDPDNYNAILNKINSKLRKYTSDPEKLYNDNKNTIINMISHFIDLSMSDRKKDYDNYNEFLVKTFNKFKIGDRSSAKYFLLFDKCFIELLLGKQNFIGRVSCLLGNEYSDSDMDEMYPYYKKYKNRRIKDYYYVDDIKKEIIYGLGNDTYQKIISVTTDAYLLHICKKYIPFIDGTLSLPGPNVRVNEDILEYVLCNPKNVTKIIKVNKI
jgi:hypothetical protein